MSTNVKINVLGVNFQPLTYPKILEIFQDWIASKVAHQVCIANVHTVVTCLDDTEFRSINNQALCTMDGMPLVWYAKMVHQEHNANRVCGPDLMLKCLDLGQEQGWKHFFLGGKQEVLADLLVVVEQCFPDAKIVGWFSPPFRDLSLEEDINLVELINTAKPDFLWVGLGAPKQEKWIAAHLHRIHVPVQIGVGAAFDFHSGHVARAPRWMQKYGLEWVYRMYKDPRLIKRYATTNPVFLLLFAKDFFCLRVFKRRVTQANSSKQE